MARPRGTEQSPSSLEVPEPRKSAPAGAPGVTSGQSRWYRRGARETRLRAHRAVTLLEVVLCLAILLAIALVVMPVLAHARQDANRSACTSNMRQCGLAIGLYLEDYDNYYPTYRVDVRSADHAEDLLYWHDHFCRVSLPLPGQVTWVSLTGPYLSSNHPHHPSLPLVHSAAVHHCPEDSDTMAATSYEYKMYLATGIPMSEVRMPAATVMLWEQWAFHNGDLYSEYDRRAELNVLFTDQHAAWLPLSKTINARYGKGPDLHWPPSTSTIPPLLTGGDVGP